jgi:hypothetical protein
MGFGLVRHFAVVPVDAIIDLPPVNRHAPWSFDAQLDVLPTNPDHLDLDIIADHDGLLCTT